jgi:phage N-6-adenine-methyltransferase
MDRTTALDEREEECVMGTSIYIQSEREQMAAKATHALQKHAGAGIEIHGIANLWPSMADDEWSEFVADIAANGLIDPIVLWRGAIVDGKHRFKACNETNTAPRFDELPAEWDEWKVATHCQSKHRRRNLTPSQRAAVAAMAIERYSSEARERQSEAGKEGGRIAGRGRPLGVPPGGGKPNGESNSEKLSAAKSAAKDMGSSERSVERAVFVQKNAPEVAELVHAGKVSLKVAERIAKEPDIDKRAAKISQLDTGARSDDAGDSWGTPPEWIDLARKTMGGIDLDPASNKEAQGVVKADRFFTKEENGLEQEWRGRVWMNPPYSQPLVTQFAEKLVAAVESGAVKQACVLVNNATDAKFLQLMLAHCSAALFPRGRVSFLIPGSGEALTGTRQGQTFLYFGPNVERFAKHAKLLGWVGVTSGADRG